MGNILTFVEYQGDSLRGSALSAISCARQLAEKHGGQVSLLLIGKGAAAAAAQAATFAPEVLVVDDAGLEAPLAETYAPIIARLAKESNASAVVCVANNLGKDILPRAAAMLGVTVGTPVTITW